MENGNERVGGWEHDWIGVTERQTVTLFGVWKSARIKTKDYSNGYYLYLLYSSVYLRQITDQKMTSGQYLICCVQIA